jgi:single-strand DNA-binding protein
MVVLSKGVGMNDLNSVNLIGRLTRDAELRYSSGGMGICKFSIAVNRSVKKNDRWVDEASFFDCTVFGKTAENIKQYLTKGQQVCISGELVQNRWEKDGKQMSRVEINVNHVQLIGGKSDKPGQKADLPNTPENFLDDSGDLGIPF